MALTDTACKNARPKAKPYKLADGGGLYLHVLPAGGRYWRLKYRFGGKEKLLAIGVYPTLGLADARRYRDEAKALLANGADPGEVKKQAKAEAGRRRCWMPDRLHALGATVLQVPTLEDIPGLVSRIARLWAELHEADPALAAELLRKLPAMRILRE